VQDPTPTHPTDRASSPHRDLPTGHEAHRTPLIHARVSDREQYAQRRAQSHVNRQTRDDRLPASHRPDASRIPPHAASAVHIPATHDQEIAEPAAWHPRADGQDVSAGRRDRLHLLPDDREGGR
jgi:hypothetical protein